VVDAHIHLYDLVFSENLPALLQRARVAGVKGWLSNSVDLASWKRTLFLSEQQPGVIPAFGIHPWRAKEPLPNDDELDEIADSAAAIGEIGLDSSCGVLMELQLERFREQLVLAMEWKVPVVIHARAPWDLILQELDVFSGSGMVHNFTGSLEVAKCLIQKGFRLSFGTALLRQPGKKLLACASAVSAGSLLVETDAPAMPFSSELNVPFNLVKVIEELAGIRGQSVSEIEEFSENNFKEMLRR